MSSGLNLITLNKLNLKKKYLLIVLKFSTSINYDLGTQRDLFSMILILFYNYNFSSRLSLLALLSVYKYNL